MGTKTEWIIYKITSNSSGKSYIGITKQGMRRRWLAHIATAKSGSPVAMSRAIRKWGADNFEVSALAVAFTFEEAAALERALIVTLGTLAPNGYNLTTGGEATYGRRVSAEVRSRMSASAKARGAHPQSAETRALMSKIRKAALTPEVRAAIGDAHRGKIVSPETRDKMRAAWARWRAAGRKHPRR